MKRVIVLDMEDAGLRILQGLIATGDVEDSEKMHYDVKFMVSYGLEEGCKLDSVEIYCEEKEE